MIKRIELDLPAHLKKFFMHEYSGYARKNGSDEIMVDQRSELGKLISLISRPIPFTQKTEKLLGPGVLHIRYYTHVQAMEVDETKKPLLVKYLDEMFRRTIICEVQGIHDLLGGDYGPHITAALKRRNIERDVDIDSQTIRKVYRDHIAKICKKREKSYA